MYAYLILVYVEGNEEPYGTIFRPFSEDTPTINTLMEHAARELANSRRLNLHQTVCRITIQKVEEV